MSAELKAYKADVTIPVYGTIADAEVYLKDKADEALSEKDKEIARQNIEIKEAVQTMKSLNSEIIELKKKLEQEQSLRSHWNEDDYAMVNEIERLFNENEKLKQKLENVQATAYADSVDAGMRERRLRRALWRAIALFCARSCEYFNGIMSHCLIGQDDLYRKCEKKKNKYLHAMYKCRAKMEEYR